MTEERKRIIELLDEVINLKKELLGTGKLRAELAAANEMANRVEIAAAWIAGAMTARNYLEKYDFNGLNELIRDNLSDIPEDIRIREFPNA